jgi:hypothetical protein
MLGVVIAMALCGSVIFAAPSSNTTILLVVVIGILLIGRYLNKVALQMDEPGQTLVYIIYYLIPHLELFDVRDLVVHNWDPIPWWACAAATLYATVYSAFFLIAGWLVFRRQSLG